MTHRALLLAITAAIALTLLPLPSASATGDSGIGDTHTPAEGTHACVVYIDRDVVPDESFLGYIAEYSSLLNGASSPWEDDFLTICGTRSLDFVPCPNAIDNSVCHGGEFTHFIPVRSHDATINGTRPSNLPATLSEILRPIDAPPSPHMPDELFAYPSKVLPGGELGVDHLFVFFIGVHPLLVWEAAAAMIHRDVPLSDFTFVNHPIIAPSSEFKDLVPPIESGGGNVGVDDDDWDEDNTSFLNSGDISSSSSNGDEEELSSKFDSSSESSMPEYLAFAEIEFHNSLQMYDFKTPISPGYKHTFPIVFIDPDPLTHGYLVGVLAYGLLSTIDIGVAQWEGDDYSRAFLSGVSHGIRSHCQSCNVYSIVLPRNDNDIVASFQTADLQTGGIPRSLIMPPFPHYMQSNRAMLERMLNTYTRPIPWDAIFLHNVFYIYAIQEHTRCLESSTVIGLLQYFSKDTLIRGGRTHGYWYSKPRDVPLVCLLSLYDSYRIPEMVSRAFSDLMDNKVEFPFDWRTGLALPTSTLTGYQHLGSAVGLSWNALGAIALTISSDVVLLLADDLSSMALYNPMRHSVMEIRYFIESAAELAFTNGFSVTQSNGTVIVSGGSTLPRATGPSTDMFAFDINGLGGDVDTLCNTFSNSCIGSTRTIGLLPIPLYGHTSVYHPPYLYIHGGTHRETGLLQNVLYRAILPSSGYPSGSLEWEALNTEGSIPRSYHTSMLFSQQGNASDYIYFLGSSQSSTLLSWYSIKEDTWGSFDLQSPIGSRPCMNAVESSVFAMSGSTMYRFEPSTQTLFQQKQNVLSSSHSMSCVTIDAPNGFIIPSTMYWQEDKQLHETDAIEDDSSTDSSDSDAVFATLHINAKKSRTTPDREKNIVVVLVLQSGSSDSISTMTFPRNLQCSTGNQILSPMGTSCVDCKPGYVANGDVCTPCESFAAKDSAGFTVYCPSTLPSSVHWAIIAGPIAVTVLLAVAVLVLWHLRRRRRDLAHQRRCNAPSSGGVFVVYFWVDKAPQLWKERSNDMAEVSSQLVQLLRCVLARHECYEVVNCGDSGLFTGRDAERVLRASSEAWLQVAQRQWCVGKLRANFLLHYDDFQCVETEVDSEYSGFWRWVESGRRARTAMTLVGGGIQHLQRTAMYVQGIVGSARFLGEYARARGDELAPLASYIDSVDGSCIHLKPPVVPHAQWEDDVVFSVVDPALDAALAPEPAVLACAHRVRSCMDVLACRGRDDPLVMRSQKVGLDVVREHGMLSECGTAMGTSAPTAEEARRRYPLVGLVKGDTVLTTYEVLLQGDVAPRHVRLPLRCFEVNAMMTVTPRCKHSPECATDETFARLLCDRDALTAEERLFVSRYQCEHCRRRVPKRVRCCRLEVVRPMERAVPNRCPFFRLSVSTHRVTMAARVAEERLQYQRLELVRRARALDSRPSLLSNVPRDLWPACQSATSGASSVAMAIDMRDVFEAGILCHPMVATGLLPAELFVHVVRMMEKLYDALLLPLRADERLEVAESVRQQLRLFTDTYPDSPERSREVALRLLQVMDMLHVKDIVEQIIGCRHF